jgi:hypothetical protein
MSYTINKVDVWATDIPNRAGTLSSVLEGVSNAGAQLEFLIARKVDDSTSRVFAAPIKGPKQQRAAASVGLARAAGMHSLRIEGPDRAGLGAKITNAVAEKGINLRGASAAAIGKKAVFYLAVESEQDLKSATQAVRKVLGK